MWLVSCRRRGMLAQGPTPDPKCKLNISSFLTLPHLLDLLICTRNSMSIELQLWMTIGGIGVGWIIYIMVWVGRQVGYYLIVFFFTCVFVFCSLVSSVSFSKWPEHDSFCVCLFVYYLFSLSLVPLTRSYSCIVINLYAMLNYL